MSLDPSHPRVGRRTYALRALAVIASLSVGGALVEVSKSSDVSILIEGALNLVAIPFFMLGLALLLGTVYQRLQDINLSVWWMLFIFVPVLNLIFFLTLLFLPSNKFKTRVPAGD